MFTVAGNTDTVSGNGLEISEKNGVPAWASISAGYQLLLSTLLPWIAGKVKKRELGEIISCDLCFDGRYYAVSGKCLVDREDFICYDVVTRTSLSIHRIFPC